MFCFIVLFIYLFTFVYLFNWCFFTFFNVFFFIRFSTLKKIFFALVFLFFNFFNNISCCIYLYHHRVIFHAVSLTCTKMVFLWCVSTNWLTRCNYISDLFSYVPIKVLSSSANNEFSCLPKPSLYITSIRTIEQILI